MVHLIRYRQGNSVVTAEAVAARYEEMVREVASGALPADARIVYKGRNRVFAICRGGEWLCVKAFRKPSLLNSYVYTHLRESKAKRSFEFANRLLTMGICTPEPIAYAEVKRRGRLLESYYISRYVEAENMRQWEDKPDAEPLLRAFAAEMVKIHRCGVLHKDFSPGNVLYVGPADGSYRFMLIDLNRMEFGVNNRSKLMRNFRAINLEAEQTRRLARYYAEAAGLDVGQTVEEASRQLEAYLRSKRRHRALKKIFKKKRK